MDIMGKLEAIEVKYEQVKEQLADPNVFSDQKKYASLSKEYKELESIVEVYKVYRDVVSNIASNQEIVDTESDPEFKEMAKMELDELLPKRETMEEEIKLMLIPKDPDDHKNVMLEVRAGTGGDEASIFAGDLFQMYSKYCESRGWKTEIMNLNEGTAGGYKEIVIGIEGSNVFGDLKYESGVHRVQRVPKTESQGRVHTSAASVAVLPEVEDVEVDINPADLRVDTFRASGAGGQHVNKTESAVRITHNPTGIVVECQEGRSQLKNREIAMKALRSKIYDKFQSEQNAAIAAERKSLVSTGDRSAKIRTYNYPQGRVTDHRIGLTLYDLDNIVGGDLQKVIDALKMAEYSDKLAGV